MFSRIILVLNASEVNKILPANGKQMSYFALSINADIYTNLLHRLLVFYCRSQLVINITWGSQNWTASLTMIFRLFEFPRSVNGQRTFGQYVCQVILLTILLVKMRLSAAGDRRRSMVAWYCYFIKWHHWVNTFSQFGCIALLIG